MDASSAYQQMQDEMSRFEAEISGSENMVPLMLPANMRPVIGAGTFGAVQQRLERVCIPPPPPPPSMMPPFDPAGMAPRMMFPGMPPPPPPPSMMVPSQVQRMRGPEPDFSQFMRPGMPGPQLLPPGPSAPQPVILSAAPKLYKQAKKFEEKPAVLEPSEPKKKKKELPPPPAIKEDLPVPEVAPLVPLAPPPPAFDPVAPKAKKEKKGRKVVRTAGGQVWEDVTLLDWPDDDFRMFCGDLGNDVTDELLTRTFGKYASFQRAKVVRDRRTNKSKGFGFISFREPADFIKAMKEMDGRYVGSRPVKLRKSTWRSRALDVVRKKEKEKAALLSSLMAGHSS